MGTFKAQLNCAVSQKFEKGKRFEVPFKFDIFCCRWSGHLCKYLYVYIPNAKNSIELHLVSPQVDQDLAFSNTQLAMGWSSVYTIQNYYYKFDYAEQSEGKLRSPSALAHSKMEHHCWVANSNSALSPSLHSKVLQPTVKPNDAHTHALVGYTKRWTPEDLIGIDKKSPTKTFQA